MDILKTLEKLQKSHKTSVGCERALSKYLVNNIDIENVDDRYKYQLTDYSFPYSLNTFEVRVEIPVSCSRLKTGYTMKSFDLRPILTAIQSKGKVSYFDIINNNL